MKKYSHFILYILFLALAIVALVYMNYMRLYLPYVFVVLALVMMYTDKENIEYQGFTQPIKFLNKKFKWLVYFRNSAICDSINYFGCYCIMAVVGKGENEKIFE